MRFYIDFEATQPENEIISIGAVAENGVVFYTLVKPRLSEISDYIIKLTKISPLELIKQPDINDALLAFDIWRKEIEPNILKCEFYSYGKDTVFIKSTLPAIENEKAFLVASYLYTKLEDATPEIFNYFNGAITLIKAFNYFEKLNEKQNHHALEDAFMLKKVLSNIEGKDPLEENPFRKRRSGSYTYPSGRFFATFEDKNLKEFKDIQEAIDWVIKRFYSQNRRETADRINISKKIMKAIRQEEKYCNCKWERKRIKNEL